jgi:hypothetical protein
MDQKNGKRRVDQQEEGSGNFWVNYKSYEKEMAAYCLVRGQQGEGSCNSWDDLISKRLKGPRHRNCVN